MIKKKINKMLIIFYRTSSNIKEHMVTYFCHHQSDNYVNLSDHYVDLSEKYNHNKYINILFYIMFIALTVTYFLV